MDSTRTAQLTTGRHRPSGGGDLTVLDVLQANTVATPATNAVKARALIGSTGLDPVALAQIADDHQPAHVATVRMPNLPALIAHVDDVLATCGTPVVAA